jgi:hypothetical protein
MSEWRIRFTDAEALQELSESLRLGPIIDEKGRRRLTEALVGRENGLKMHIFSNEHPPPHFCVSYQGKTANYRISNCAKLNGSLDEFYKNIQQWHAKHKPDLIKAWNASRPTNCPVGEYKEGA